MTDTHCRISKVVWKDGRAPLHIVNRPAEPFCARAARNMASIISDQTVMVGFFVMARNGRIRTGYTYLPGVTDANYMGGIKMMELDWIEREINAPPPFGAS